MKRRKFRQGDRVRWAAFGRAGDTGTVQRVTPKARIVGGARALVVVKWDSGHTGSVEDRVLVQTSGGEAMTATINVNIAARHGACSAGHHDSNECEPINLPCRLPPSFTCSVVLGECTCLDGLNLRDMPQDTGGDRYTPEVLNHAHTCPARPVRVSATITSPDGSWEKSEVADIDPIPELWGANCNMRAVARDRWALVKAVVTGEPQEGPGGGLIVAPMELFAQRDTVFAAITKGHRAEDELIEALGDYEVAMRGEPVGIYGLKRESHGALERYVELMIEQVGTIRGEC